MYFYDWKNEIIWPGIHRNRVKNSHNSPLAFLLNYLKLMQMWDIDSNCESFSISFYMLRELASPFNLLEYWILNSFWTFCYLKLLWLLSPLSPPCCWDQNAFSWYKKTKLDAFLMAWDRSYKYIVNIFKSKQHICCQKTCQTQISQSLMIWYKYFFLHFRELCVLNRTFQNA